MAFTAPLVADAFINGVVSDSVRCRPSQGRDQKREQKHGGVVLEVPEVLEVLLPWPRYS